MDLARLEQQLMQHPDLSQLSAKEQFAILTEHAKHVAGEDRLLHHLQQSKKTRKPLTIKFGIDPTGKDIHLGHAVPLMVLRRFQNMGHTINLVVGDFTARVGDPSGQKATRPVLTEQEIKKNAATYADQACAILNMKKTQVRYNSEWLGSEIGLTDVLRMARGVRVATAMQREDFRARRDSLTRAELLYSILMAADSVVLKADVEVGGDDQLLNFMDTIDVMRNEGMEPEAAVTTDILLGTSGEGKKMSKSLGNYIPVQAPPEDMYGKLLSIPDALLESYFVLLTDIRKADRQQLMQAIRKGTVHPMDAKRMMARVVTADLHGVSAAHKAEKAFNAQVVGKQAPDDLNVVPIPASKAATWVDIVVATKLPTVTSKSAARRLLAQKGVHMQDKDGSEAPVEESTPIPKTPTTLRVGKRHYVKFRIVS